MGNVFIFNVIWSDLSIDGKCDSPGGREYCRVLQEWHDAGCPLPLIPFIIARANISPTSSATPPAPLEGTT